MKDFKIDTKNKNFMNDFFLFIKAMKYYSSKKIANIDVHKLITPKVYLERAIGHLLTYKFPSKHYLNHVKQMLKKSIVKYDSIDKIINYLDSICNKIENSNSINWSDKENIKKYQSKKEYLKKGVKPYIDSLKKLKKTSFNNYDNDLFDKANRSIRNIHIKSNSENLIKIAESLVAFLLELGYSSEYIENWAKKTHCNLKKVNDYISAQDSVTALIHHFSPEKRIKNKWSVCFPTNYNKETYSLKNIKDSFYQKGISIHIMSYKDIEKKIQIKSYSKIENLKKDVMYIVLEGYESLDHKIVMEKSIEEHIKWISGYANMAFNKSLIDENAKVIIYQVDSERFWHSENYVVKGYNNAEFLHPEGNISKLVELHSVIKSPEILQFIQNSLSLKGHNNSKLSKTLILNISRIVDSFPGYNGKGAYDSAIHWIKSLSYIGYIKSSLISYAKWIKKMLEKSLKHKIKEDMDLGDMKKIYDEKFIKNIEDDLFKYLNKNSLLFLEKKSMWSDMVSFIYYESRTTRNEYAHERSKSFRSYKNIVINNLDSLISIILFDMIYISYEKTEILSNNFPLKKFLNMISEDNIERRKKYLKNNNIFVKVK